MAGEAMSRLTIPGALAVPGAAAEKTRLLAALAGPHDGPLTIDVDGDGAASVVALQMLLSVMQSAMAAGRAVGLGPGARMAVSRYGVQAVGAA